MGAMGETSVATRVVDLRLPSPVEALLDDSLVARGVRLYLKRDDLIHPDIPGNKWRKLKHNLEAAVSLEHRTLLTFGGAYSNHIRATAAAGSLYGLATIGVIRGERHDPLNPSLAYAMSRGMTLTYLDRESYRRKHSAEIVEALHRQFGDFYLVPEGGTNELGVRGCAEIPQEIEVDFDVICCACGTGGTLAGIAAGLRDGQRAVGFSALKGARSLDGEVDELQRRAFGANSTNWTIEHDFHFGGFARRTPDLEAFIASFEDRHALRLEWVYVAKMMSGVFHLVNTGAFPPGTSIMAVITG
jgi:1-aminocyclopropane-1-carboxylate deaminase